MAHMVFCEKQLRQGVEIRIDFFQHLAKHVFLEKLFLYPDRDRHLEGFETARRKGEIGFQEPFEFKKRLVVEGDMIDVAQLQPTLGQTIGNGVVRETGIVFFACEALFLSCCHDLAVDDKRGSTVVIKGGHSENAHQTLQAGCIGGGRMQWPVAPSIDMNA